MIIYIIRVKIFCFEAFFNAVLFAGNTLEGFYSRNEAEIWKILQDSVKLGQFAVPLKVDDQSFPTLILEAESIEIVSKDDNRYGTSKLLSFLLRRKKNHNCVITKFII